MSSFSVVFDACVLYPADLRDILMQLALTNLFEAKWTELIHEEWIRSILKNRKDLTKEKLQRTAKRMNERLPDALVNDYEDLIESLKLPDANDRHVLAAAIKSGSQVIVTYNIADFPEAELQKYNIEAQHPDEFIDNTINLSSNNVLEGVQEIQSRLNNPPKSIDELIEIYKSRKLQSLVDFLEARKSEFNC